MSSKQQLGPSLGMKKSSSLESLQTMVQEVKMSDIHDKIKYDQNLRIAADKDNPNELRLGTCLYLYF